MQRRYLMTPDHDAVKDLNKRSVEPLRCADGLQALLDAPGSVHMHSQLESSNVFLGPCC